MRGMEPGDWKYAVVIAVMIGSLVLVGYSVPRMTEAEDRFRTEMMAANALPQGAERDAHLAAAGAAERDRLTWGSWGTLGSLLALLSLLSLFFVGIRGPMGRGGMSKQVVKDGKERSEPPDAGRKEGVKDA
jgi:hypothetical protein